LLVAVAGVAQLLALLTHEEQVVVALEGSVLVLALR
jgi:hypothetical protein